MLKRVEPEEILKELTLSEDIVLYLKELIYRIKYENAKIITKIKYLKSGIYINVYEYEKYNWKYNLIKEIEVMMW
jgi:hypothetical protein